MNTPASDACQIPMNPDVVATVQNTPASAVVPSREAVEFSCRVVRETAQHLTAQGSTEAKNLFGEVEHNLRTLLAEVERLTDRNEMLDLQLTAAVQEYRKARVTVAEQGAALAELRRIVPRLRSVLDTSRLEPEDQQDIGSVFDELAALASAQSSVPR